MHVKPVLLTAIGYLFLGLAAIGLFLPVWPTTPFVLIAAACFSSTPGLRSKIVKINFFREHIENYEQRNGLSKRTVAISLIYLWVMIIISMILIRKPWICAGLFAIAITVTVHILCMAKPKREHREEDMKRVFGTMEAVFDLFYLISAFIIGIILLVGSDNETSRLLAGAMALLLVGGDLFHLAPRVTVILVGDELAMRKALGRGKQITSISMTLFYLLLWLIGRMEMFTDSDPRWTYLLFILAIIRIALCFMPQNRWLERYPPLNWGIVRNIPFVFIGAIIGSFFFIYRSALPGLELMWLAIALSFAFYLPVVLFTHKNPKIGMLMMPKTCCYIWMLAMCLSL